MQMIDASEDCGKSVTITDKFRSNEKLVTANSLDQFLEIGDIIYLIYKLPPLTESV